MTTKAELEQELAQAREEIGYLQLANQTLREEIDELRWPNRVEVRVSLPGAGHLTYVPGMTDVPDPTISEAYAAMAEAAAKHCRSAVPAQVPVDLSDRDRALLDALLELRKR